MKVKPSGSRTQGPQGGISLNKLACHCATMNLPNCLAELGSCPKSLEHQCLGSVPRNIWSSCCQPLPAYLPIGVFRLARKSSGLSVQPLEQAPASQQAAVVPDTLIHCDACFEFTH
eukprot:jgi/Botrbrau1/16378/Bobra.85_2s0003.1